MSKPEIDEPCIAVPLKEWERMNRRIGFLEAIWMNFNPEISEETIDRINKRYAEICGEVKP